MTEHQTTLYTLLAVLAILVVVMLYNNSRARREGESPSSKGSGDDEGFEDVWLLKFVRHEGGIVGETVAREDDQLILKQAGVFKMVPTAIATVTGDEIVLRGDVDWDAAISEGARWHEAHTKGHDPMVTEHLTRSEDVRNPALKALKDRDEEE